MLSLHSLRSSSNTPETSRRSDTGEHRRPLNRLKSSSNMYHFVVQVTLCVDLLLLTGSIADGSDRGEGRRRVLGSLDEDDPNILLAIQLSLQESRRERGLEERPTDRRAASAGELVDLALHSLTTDATLGARGSSFPLSLLDPPQPPNRTDSQPSVSSSIPLPPPPPSLSAELLELGDSLLKLSSISNPFDPDTQRLRCSQFSCGHSDPTPRPEHDHLTLTEQSCCAPISYSEPEHTASPAQTSTHPDPYAPDHLTLHVPKPDSSYCTSELSLDSAPYAEPQPPTVLCLPSPEPEPELLLSPVIPQGGAFTPSDPQSLEALDPTASAQLLDNIMAWFNNNINPQNNPQSLALIPSPPTTETDSSPDTLTETESPASRDTVPVPALWQPLEGEPSISTVTPGLELDHRDSGGGTGCELSLDEEHTQPHSESSPIHTAPQQDQSPEEWEEQVHLV